MKKILACGLILSTLMSVGSVCFASRNDDVEFGNLEERITETDELDRLAARLDRLAEENAELVERGASDEERLNLLREKVELIRNCLRLKGESGRHLESFTWICAGLDYDRLRVALFEDVDERAIQWLTQGLDESRRESLLNGVGDEWRNMLELLDYANGDTFDGDNAMQFIHTFRTYVFFVDQVLDENFKADIEFRFYKVGEEDSENDTLCVELRGWSVVARDDEHIQLVLEVRKGDGRMVQKRFYLDELDALEGNAFVFEGIRVIRRLG